MLILFDIDGTLLRTEGMGLSAIENAGKSLFGERFTTQGIDAAGRIDPLIFSEMLRNSGAPDTPASHAALRTLYTKTLLDMLKQNPTSTRAMPGVHALLDLLEVNARDRTGHAAITLGVLTGNFEATGKAKMRACKIDPDRFHIGVWGDDSPHTPPSRDHLVPVGIDRAKIVRGGNAVTPERVLVIGDTPHDVRCAKVHGCRALGVATGRFSRDELAASGADLAVEDLSATAEIHQWILNERLTGG